MRRFWKRSQQLGELEAALRRDRPAPGEELVERMLGLVDEPRAPLAQPRQRRRSRPAIAALVAVVSLLAFAVFGGLGYAKSSSSGAFHRAAHSFGKIIKNDSPRSTSSEQGKKGKKDDGPRIVSFQGKEEEDEEEGPGDDQYREKVLICHAAFPIKAGQPVQYITLKLPPSGAAAHLNNHPNDTAGPCNGRKDDD